VAALGGDDGPVDRESHLRELAVRGSRFAVRGSQFAVRSSQFAVRSLGIGSWELGVWPECIVNGDE
jgi:hypothetical protein